MLFFLKTVKRITVCVSDDYLISRIFALVKVCNDQGKDQSHLHAVTLFLRDKPVAGGHKIIYNPLVSQSWQVGQSDQIAIKSSFHCLTSHLELSLPYSISVLCDLR